MPSITFSPKLLHKIRTNTYTEKELDLSRQALSDKNIADLVDALSRNTHIKSLAVQGCEIGDIGARALAASETLTTVNLSHNKIGPSGARALAANETLITLYLNSNKIGPDGARAFLAANKTLTSLNVSDNDIRSFNAEALAANRAITSLNLPINNNIGLGGLRPLLANLTPMKLEMGHHSITSTMQTQLDTMLARNRRLAALTGRLVTSICSGRAVSGTALAPFRESILPLTDIIHSFAGFDMPAAAEKPRDEEKDAPENSCSIS